MYDDDMVTTKKLSITVHALLKNGAAGALGQSQDEPVCMTTKL